MLTQLQAAIAAAEAGPRPDCYVQSDPDPPTGESTKGFRDITLYKPFALIRFHIQHADPDETFLPLCEPPIMALERVLRSLETTVQNGGLRTLQCTAR